MNEDTGVPIKTKYEINLTSSEEIVYTDIQYVAFIRAPIIKQASYCIVQLNLPIIIAEQLQYNIAENIFDIWNMQIFSIGDSETDQKQGLIFNKQYTILSMQKQEIVVFEKATVLVKLVLVNPILYALETSTSFNKIISEKTAYEAIDEFEDFIDETYGQFNYNHVGVTESVNKYRYEQIFIPPTINTLNVPKYIINTYKPFHSYSIYFFDDFYFSDESDKAITCHFLNLADVFNQFSDYDIQNYLDYMRMTRKVDIKNFTDPFRLLDRDFSSIVYKTKDIAYSLLKQTKASAPQLILKNSKDSIEIDKTKKFTDSQLQNSTTKQSVRASIIYVPDNKTNAEERMKIAKDLMFKKLENIEFYETENSVPFWMQFGYLYNMNVTSPYDYLHTPIGIVNIFRREEQRGDITHCTHMCKYIMLKLNNNS